MNTPIRVALTPGEPAGIGPDLCLRLAHSPQQCELVAVCDPALLADRAERLGTRVTLRDFNPDTAARPHVPGELPVLPVRLSGPVRCGTLQPEHARYVLSTLDAAVEGCEKGTFDAMVTGPVHKGAINAAGIPFTGHTEYLAQRTGGGPVAMLLTAPGIRVALLTTHLPLAAVPAAITAARLTEVVGILARDFPRRLGIVHPRILVCGLNPHAGESGHLGREELEIIGPALEALRAQGIADLFGPVPADTAFTPPRLEHSDVVLAMYHDQGLPVLKHMGFGEAVNVTLGLPIIRTSVDHGTALELAGSGRADPGSLQTALRYAEQMAHRESQPC